MADCADRETRKGKRSAKPARWNRASTYAWCWRAVSCDGRRCFIVVTQSQTSRWRWSSSS